MGQIAEEKSVLQERKIEQICIISETLVTDFNLLPCFTNKKNQNKICITNKDLVDNIIHKERRKS